jgi:hypothetical protein
MTADDRHAWIKVARETLKGIPADLMALGCLTARRKCKFVSEIVPTIIETIGSMWERRKREEIEARCRSEPRRLSPPPPPPEYIPAEEMRKLIRSISKAA